MSRTARFRLGVASWRAVRAAALAASIAITGCASQSYVVLLPSPDGSVGQVVIRGEKGEQLLSSAGQAGSLDGSGTSKTVQKEQIDRDFGDAIAARPRIPIRYLLYFRTGTSLTAESEALIPRIIEEANSRPAVDVSVIGHTDTVYTTQFNEQLALARSNKVSELLQSRGLKANSITVESHGKRNLLIQTPDNTFEPRNRRVEVSVR
jgi:peptidoglycan-associated lipoprotein